MDSILGDRIADELIDIGGSALGKGVVPHLEQLVLFVVDDTSRLQDKVSLPGAIRFHDRVLWNLLGSGVVGTTATQPDSFHAINKHFIDEELGTAIYLD